MSKSLCLVLALVFVLGLCTVGAGAVYAPYSDLDKVTPEYTDAIEVLSGLLIIDGYPDGTFGPEKNVTRAEAAAMITRMMLGREAADKLPVGEVKFSDVAADSWAAKYIAFCANKGIIVGMGNGTFCPNDNITGTQLAAMLLRALGYDAMGEYQGKGWDINAVADALYYGVFKDSQVVDFNKAATREETALYIWNTLWINLVGYDVDLNYYKEKTRVIDGKTVELTFANDAYNLVELGYKSRTNPGTYVVLGNKATGDKYTILGNWDWTYRYYTDKDNDGVWDRDKEGNYIYEYEYGWVPKIYVDYEYPEDADLLSYFGHEVTIFFDGDAIEDTEEHRNYYKCYLLRDDSTVMEYGSKADDFYRAAKAANDSNADLWFAGIKTITNYDYTNVGNAAKDASDGDHFGSYFERVFDLKGQKSSNDSAPRGTWILDHAGRILVELKDKYYVGKVIEVDNSHEEVEINYYKGTEDDHVTKIYDTDVFDFTWEDVQLVYDGIAKNDYAVVKPVGKLTYVEPTTTQTVDITQKMFFIFGWYFNNFSIGPDLNGLGIDVKGMDDPEKVNPGDKVLFYMTSAGYFALEIVEKAKTEGIVYINHIGEYISYGPWDQIIKTGKDNEDNKSDEDQVVDDSADLTNIRTVIKVQGINQDGEEVVYTFGKTAWNSWVNRPVVGNVYEVRKSSSGYIFDDDLEDVQELENKSGKANFLKNTYTDEDGRRHSDVYYVTKDTKVIYFQGEGANLFIEVSNKLTTAEKIIALIKDMGGSKKIVSAWVPGVEAPDTYDSGSYLYVAGGQKYNGAPTYEWYNEENTPAYMVFVDGVYQKMYLSAPSDCYDPVGPFTKKNTISAGFYEYTDYDGDGIYDLAPAAKSKRFVALGVDGNGMIDDEGYLYVEDVYGTMSDGIKLNVDVFDVSGGTTTGTKTDAAVNSVERIAELLSEGYTIYVDYMYTVVEGKQIPVGTMFVSYVVAP